MKATPRRFITQGIFHPRTLLSRSQPVYITTAAPRSHHLSAIGMSKDQESMPVKSTFYKNSTPPKNLAFLPISERQPLRSIFFKARYLLIVRFVTPQDARLE